MLMFRLPNYWSYEAMTLAGIGEEGVLGRRGYWGGGVRLGKNH